MKHAVNLFPIVDASKSYLRIIEIVLWVNAKKQNTMIYFFKVHSVVNELNTLTLRAVAVL